MGSIHTQITDYLWTQSWQIMVIAVVIAVAAFALRNKSAHVRYLLWLIVLARCLMPPLLTIPLAILPEEGQAEPVTEAAAEMSALSIEAVDVTVSEPLVLPSAPVAMPPAPTFTERLASVTIQQWLAFGWIIGATVFVLAVVIRALRTNRWLQRDRRPLPTSLQTEIENFFADLGIRTFPKVWLLDGIGQPFVWGLLRGNIYLPANFARIDSPRNRGGGVLGHELSHVLRFDAAVNVLQIIAQAIFWFHPFVWWANKRIRAEREKCCDEMVIAQSNALPRDYSTAIVNTLIVEHESTQPIPSLAVAGPVKNIEDRIKTVMHPGKKFYKRPSLITTLTILALALIAVPTTLALTSRTKTEQDLVATQHNEEDVSKLTVKLIQLASVEPEAITVERLADICEAMESAIVDISMEYEWYVEPPGTVEDIAGTGMLISKGRLKYEWSTARPFGEKVRFISSTTIMNADGDSWNSVTKKSYNGKFGKNVWISLTLDGVLRTTPDGTITKSKRFMPSLILSPLGFSVLRLSFSKVAGNEPLSAVLRRKEFVHLDNTVEKVNGFNTIRADFLIRSDDPKTNKRVYLRVYFSVEHGYTPIRYEHIRLGRPESGKPEIVAGTIEVNSLEQVAEGLWFPSGGRISDPDDKQANVYRAISKIGVNQGLTDEYFDIEFPQGTKVRDEIRDTEYIVKPTKEQKEKFEKEKQWVKEHADEMAEMEKEGGRVYSAARLIRLGGVKDVYMMMVKDKKFPQALDELEPYFNDKEIFSWLLKNVEYLGAGLEPDKVDASKTPIAYDKTLLKKGEGTNVLFVNGLVEFCRPDRLEKLGVAKPLIEIESRFLLVPADANEIKDFFEKENLTQTKLNQESTYCFLDSEQLNHLLKLCPNIPGYKVLTSPKVMVFDGEDATLTVESEVDYISGYTEPNFPSDEPEPKHDSVTKGSRIQLMPKIQPDNKNILLKFDLELSDIARFEKRMYKQEYPYKIPEMEMISINTRLLIPDGQTLLIAGQEITAEQDDQIVRKELLVLIEAEQVGRGKAQVE